MGQELGILLLCAIEEEKFWETTSGIARFGTEACQSVISISSALQ